MATLSELRSELNSKISASIDSGFWKEADKDVWINQAGQRVCDFKRWGWLELALKTQTRDSKEYYDYPEAPNEFKKDSIFQISVEGEEYPWDQGARRRVTWNQYVKLKQNGVEDKIFTNHNGFYFLNPIPDNGKEMTIYGLKTWQKLVDEDDVSIAPDAYNEAIVRVALATAFRKAKKYNEAQVELLEIFQPEVGVLALLWLQENDEAPQGYSGQAQSSRWN